MVNILKETESSICFDTSIYFPFSQMLNKIKEKWGDEVDMSNIEISIEDDIANESWVEFIQVRLIERN